MIRRKTCFFRRLKEAVPRRPTPSKAKEPGSGLVVCRTSSRGRGSGRRCSREQVDAARYFKNRKIGM
jgi:hypothetical protein